MAALSGSSHYYIDKDILEQAILEDSFSAFVEITWRCVHLGGYCTLHFPLSCFCLRGSFHALESEEEVNIFGQ